MNLFGVKEKELMFYIILGFLEAGKTNLIKDLVSDDMFDDTLKTLIIVCEEGELEYEPELLSRTNSVLELIEEEEDFGGEHIADLINKHCPDRVIIKA